MNCRQFARLVRIDPELLPGFVGRRISAEMDAHAAGCTRCRDLRGQMDRLSGLLQDAYREVAASHDRRIPIPVLRTQRLPAISRRMWWVPAVALGGVVAAIVSLEMLHPKPTPTGAMIAGTQPGAVHPGPGSVHGTPTHVAPTAGQPVPAGRFVSKNARPNATQVAGTPCRPAERTGVTPFAATLPMPDSRYLDGRDGSLMARWFRSSQPDGMLARLLTRPLPPVRDDFVTVPLPRLADASGKPGAVKDAVKNYQKEATVVDARLFHKVTLELKGVSLTDLCEELQKQTEVKFEAGRPVRDENVTVFVKDVPARDVMREVARLFGFLWIRSGQEGGYRYELTQDLRSQLAEEEMRSKDMNEALLSLDEKMNRYRPYLDLTPDQAAERARKTDGADRDLLQRLSQPYIWAGVQSYFRLAPGDRSALVAGDTLKLSTQASRPDRQLPDSWNIPLLKTGDGMVWDDSIKNFRMGPMTFLQQQGHSPTAFEDWQGASAEVSLTINRSELGQLDFSIGNALTFPVKYPDGRESTVGRGLPPQPLVQGQSPSVARPQNAENNQALRKDPRFREEISLDPVPSCPTLKEHREAARPGALSDRPATPEGERELALAMARASRKMSSVDRELRVARPHVITADVWEEVYRKTGMPIVADSYSRIYPQASLVVKKATRFDALCHEADGMGVRWTKDGSFLLGRSTSFFWDKLKEVPRRQLEKWRRDSRSASRLPLEDLLEMSSLTDRQLDSDVVRDVVAHCWGLGEWDQLRRTVGYYSMRPWARFLLELSPAQRDQALSANGLAMSGLNARQQQQLMRSYIGQYGDIDTSWLKAPMALRYSYAAAGTYLWRAQVSRARFSKEGHAMPLIVRNTAEEALAAARSVDPSATADQIERSDGVFYLSFSWADGQPTVVAGVPPIAVE